jgi:hypothetical protein
MIVLGYSLYRVARQRKTQFTRAHLGCTDFNRVFVKPGRGRNASIARPVKINRDFENKPAPGGDATAAALSLPAYLPRG